MKSGWRIVIAAAAAVQAAAPATAFAQNAVTPAPPGNATDIGPPQLRDFTLNGTVTRPAEPRTDRPAPGPPAPAPQAQRPQPSSTTALPPARPPSQRAPAPAPAAPSATLELPPPSPSAALPPTVGEAVEIPPPEAGSGAFAPETPPATQSPAILPWLLAAVLAGAGAAFYFFRLRPRAQLASGFDIAGLTAPETDKPRPAPPPPPPEARPKPAMPAGGAVVSTALRPWIDVDFLPERAIVDEESIAIEYGIALYNSGSAPARDVVVEAAMFNANPAQDRQISAFFASPAGGGDRIELVAPLQRVVARGSITVPRSQVHPLLADGRPLLVPMTALNILYRWGSNRHGQTSASHLVGKDTGGDKLAPFRLDLGPRVFRRLAAREHQLRVRK